MSLHGVLEGKEVEDTSIFYFVLRPGWAIAPGAPNNGTPTYTNGTGQDSSAWSRSRPGVTQRGFCPVRVLSTPPQGSFKARKVEDHGGLFRRWDCLRQRDRPYPPGCEHRASGGFPFKYILRGALVLWNGRQAAFLVAWTRKLAQRSYVDLTKVDSNRLTQDLGSSSGSQTRSSFPSTAPPCAHRNLGQEAVRKSPGGAGPKGGCRLAPAAAQTPGVGDVMRAQERQ